MDRMAQLLLNDPMFALSTLKGSLVAGSRSAVSALQAKPFECVASFQSGLSACLKKVVDIKVGRLFGNYVPYVHTALSHKPYERLVLSHKLYQPLTLIHWPYAL